MEILRRCSDLIRRHRPAPGSQQSAAMKLYLRRVADEVEAGLRDIDFDQVTPADRIAFVECAVARQVRLALQCGRLDLAVQLQRFGAERIADLYEGAHGWRPILLYGVPSARRGEVHPSR